MTLDLAGLKKLTEECHEVTICWFDKDGRQMGSRNGCPELMGQLLAHIDELSGLQKINMKDGMTKYNEPAKPLKEVADAAAKEICDDLPKTGGQSELPKWMSSVIYRALEEATCGPESPFPPGTQFFDDSIPLTQSATASDPALIHYAEIAKGCEEQINAQEQEHMQGDFGDRRSRADLILETILLVTDHEARKETDAEVEKALQTVIHWTTDWQSTSKSKRDSIVSGLREFCGDALKRMRGERAQTPEERIIYLERALGSVAHVCCNNDKPQQLPYQVRGIVERAIRGVPHPNREPGNDD